MNCLLYRSKRIFGYTCSKSGTYHYLRHKRGIPVVKWGLMTDAETTYIAGLLLFIFSAYLSLPARWSDKFLANSFGIKDNVRREDKQASRVPKSKY